MAAPWPRAAGAAAGAGICGLLAPPPPVARRAGGAARRGAAPPAPRAPARPLALTPLRLRPSTADRPHSLREPPPDTYTPAARLPRVPTHALQAPTRTLLPCAAARGAGAGRQNRTAPGSPASHGPHAHAPPLERGPRFCVQPSPIHRGSLPGRAGLAARGVGGGGVGVGARGAAASSAPACAWRRASGRAAARGRAQPGPMGRPPARPCGPNQQSSAPSVPPRSQGPPARRSEMQLQNAARCRGARAAGPRRGPMGVRATAVSAKSVSGTMAELKAQKKCGSDRPRPPACCARLDAMLTAAAAVSGACRRLRGARARARRGARRQQQNASRRR